MEDIRTDSVMLFDTYFSNNHLRMFKVLFPFLSPSMQKSIAFYIKYSELQYALHTFQTNKYPQSSTFDFDNVCEQLLPYCEPSEKQRFMQIRSFLQTLHNMQDMMEMMEALKDIFPEGMNTSENNSAGFNPEMFTTLSSMFGGGDMDLGTIMNMFSNNN